MTRLNLNPALVSSVWIEAPTDAAVDAVYESLGGPALPEDDRTEPSTCQPFLSSSTGRTVYWRSAALTVGGVRFSITGPHHEVQPVPEIPADGPCLVIGEEGADA